MAEEFSDEEQPSGEQKRFLFIMRRPPHGSIYPYEGLEVILIMAAYDQIISVCFVDDGVLCLKKGQDVSGIGVKEYSITFKVLEPYGIEHVYVDRESLEKRGLTEKDLICRVEVVDRNEIAETIREQDVILPF